MKRLMTGATILAFLASPVANAQPDNHRGHRGDSEQRSQRGDGAHREHRSDGENHGGQWHDGRWHDQAGRRDNGRHLGWSRDRGHYYHWGRGQRMGYNDWRYAQRIDYRRYDLRQPPSGYEWRRNNDRFVMVDTATGLIASVIRSNGR